MEKKPVSVSALKHELVLEILTAFNLPSGKFWQTMIGSWMHKPTTRFSEIFATLDQDIAAHGLTEAVRRMLPNFVDKTKAIGVENFPAEGPLLVTSNHPGTYDALSIVANAPRDDFKIVVGGMPFLKKLPIASNHLIHSDRHDNNVRATVVRSSIRHLQDGGALLIFPSGRIDPDPAVLPGAKEALEYWSKSIAIMLRRAPETRLLTAITSGVLHERFTRTPLTFLKADGVGKRRIMEFIQVIRQLLMGEDLGLTPLVTFDKPLTVQELCASWDSEQLLQAIIERAREVLNQHQTQLNLIREQGFKLTTNAS
jgi:1-acyl-sn-glycerol-3-phosphate acyltransferase